MSHMPDLNKPAFKVMPKAAQRIANRQCPLCAKDIGPDEFRDMLSLQEYRISGMCQDCQDKIFGEE